jgi:hypothetical protein
MKRTRPATLVANRNNNISLRTSFWELIQELSAMTKDDKLVIAAMQSIFATHHARIGSSLAPVRLVSSESPAKGKLKS